MNVDLKSMLKSVALLLLFSLFTHFSFAQKTDSPKKAAKMPVPVMAVPVDTIAMPHTTTFEWIIEKELWYDPSDYSFFLTTSPRLTSKWDDSSSKTYMLSQVDRPPFYGDKCLKADNPWECSRQNITETLMANIEYPDAALRKGHDGREVVTFTLNKYGQVEGTYKVLSKDKPCAECAQAAVDAVATLRNWYPAMKDGKFVKTQITIPVVFEIVNQ